MISYRCRWCDCSSVEVLGSEQVDYGDVDSVALVTVVSCDLCGKQSEFELKMDRPPMGPDA